MENLAPAGTREALDRAVAAGADAVYLGYAAFSARAGAGNFDEQQLREAVAFAHLHHVRVHVTVNTLIKDGELDDVLDVLRLLRSVPVDAVLVQDLGVLAMARQCFPDLPIHASTQMALHNATGVRWAKRMGMKRVVLARECSLDEITKAAAEGVEVEVFGHGAQCVGVSGECLFSSMLGERSGNRGRCAQPCRLKYTYRGQSGAWLSPRDVCLRDHLPALQKAGAVSVKLEGRLKRPEYVAVVANSYRNAIDAMDAGTFTPADETEMRGLKQIFQRGGFMKGYAMGAEDAAVIAPERVNHSGVAIGEITGVRGNLAQMLLTLDLHDGDQLQIRTARGDAEMIYAGHEQAAGSTATLRLRDDMRVKPGDEVYRLVDESQLQAARAMPIKPIAVTCWLRAMPGEALTLTVSDGESHATVTGDTVSAAQKRAMTEEDAIRSLGKMGDTPYELADCHVETENAFVPVSMLNAIRRDALDALTEARCAAFAISIGDEQPLAPCVLPEGDVPTTVIFRSRDQLPLAQSVGEDVRLVWYPEDWYLPRLREELALLPDGVWLHLPTVCEEFELVTLYGFVHGNRDKLGGVVLGSVGQLGFDWHVPYGAGQGVPVMNRRAAQFLFDQGCQFVTASCELSGRELKTLMAGQPPILVPTYGRTQLMLLHHCPARTYLGLTEGHARCEMCDRHDVNSLEDKVLFDRQAFMYPLLRQHMPEGCIIRLMNAVTTDLRKEMKNEPYAQLYELTTESTAMGLEPVRTTKGHYNRPVE